MGTEGSILVLTYFVVVMGFYFAGYKEVDTMALGGRHGGQPALSSQMVFGGGGDGGWTVPARGY